MDIEQMQIRMGEMAAEIERLNSAWKVETLNRKDLIIAKQEAENDRLKAENARLQSIIYLPLTRAGFPDLELVELVRICNDQQHKINLLNAEREQSDRAMKGEIILCDSLRRERDTLNAEREKLMAQEPVAYCVFAETGNIRIWWSNQGDRDCRAKDWADSNGLSLTSLYAQAPLEPTDAMIDAGVAMALQVSVHGQDGWSKYIKGLYKQMIAARPKPEGK